MLRPVFYINHQHSLDSRPAVAIPLGGAAIVFAFVLVRAIRRASPSASQILEVTAALGLGGALANLVEVLANGYVTDFLGIHGSGGIYSAGDMALDIGIALLPFAAFRVAAATARQRNALLAGAFAYLSVIVIALMNPRSFGVAILATIIVVVSATVLLVKSTIKEHPDGTRSRNR